MERVRTPHWPDQLSCERAGSLDEDVDLDEVVWGEKWNGLHPNKSVCDDPSALNTSQRGRTLRAWTAVKPLVGPTLLVVFLLLALSRVLPTALAPPTNYAGDQGAVNHQDGVVLAVGDIAPDDLVVLRWDWRILDGLSKPTLYVSVHTSGGTGALIFTGPISARVTGCRVDGIPTSLAQGRPAFQVRGAPAVGLVDQSLVARIDFDIAAGPPGGPAIYCDLRDGYSADDPPYHQFYTPELRIAAQGKVATNHDSVSACASRSLPGSPTASQCMGREESTTAVLPMSVEEVNRPAEQGLRDARLVIVGVLAGIAGQAIWELGRRLLSLGRVGVRKVLAHTRRQSRRVDPDEDGMAADAEAPDPPPSADSAPADAVGGNAPESAALDPSDREVRQ